MEDNTKRWAEKYETKTEQELLKECELRNLKKAKKHLDIVDALIKDDIDSRHRILGKRPEYTQYSDPAGMKEYERITSDAAFKQRNKETPRRIKIAQLKKALNAEEKELAKDTKVINDDRDMEIEVMRKRLARYKFEDEKAHDDTTTSTPNGSAGSSTAAVTTSSLASAELNISDLNPKGSTSTIPTPKKEVNKDTTTKPNARSVKKKSRRSKKPSSDDDYEPPEVQVSRVGNDYVSKNTDDEIIHPDSSVKNLKRMHSKSVAGASVSGSNKKKARVYGETRPADAVSSAQSQQTPSASFPPNVAPNSPPAKKTNEKNVSQINVNDRNRLLIQYDKPFIPDDEVVKSLKEAYKSYRLMDVVVDSEYGYLIYFREMDVGNEDMKKAYAKIAADIVNSEFCDPAAKCCILDYRKG